MQKYIPSRTGTTQENVVNSNLKPNERTAFKTSRPLTRGNGSDAWHQYKIGHGSVDNRLLNTLKLFIDYLDRFSTPHEFWTINAITACIRACIERISNKEDYVIP